MKKRFEGKVFGQVRYITYFLHFPDGDHWVDQQPMVHDIAFELKNMHGINKDPRLAKNMLKNGEASWKDSNGVWHQLIIEEKKRERKWGIQRQ